MDGSQILVGPGRSCAYCGEDYGQHAANCVQKQQEKERRNRPRRFRVLVDAGAKHPSGSASRFIYGCYFPLTDLVVGDMGHRGTGCPSGVEWLDEEQK